MNKHPDSIVSFKQKKRQQGVVWCMAQNEAHNDLASTILLFEGFWQPQYLSFRLSTFFWKIMKDTEK